MRKCELKCCQATFDKRLIRACVVGHRHDGMPTLRMTLFFGIQLIAAIATPTLQ